MGGLAAAALRKNYLLLFMTQDADDYRLTLPGIACRRICIAKILKGPKIMHVTPALAWESRSTLLQRILK
jgi:hypothetical protein